MPKRGIYTLTNPDGEIYVGHSTDLVDRKRQHRSSSHITIPLLQDSFDKYGQENHIFEVVLKDNSLSKKDLFYFEKVFIRFYMNQGKTVLNKNYTGIPRLRRKEPRPPRSIFIKNGKERPIRRKKHDGKNLRTVKVEFEDGSVQKFRSIREAASLLNINHYTLARHMNNGGTFIHDLDGNILKIKARYARKRRRYKHKQSGFRKTKPVMQYSLEGEFIRGFSCVSEASKETGVNLGNIGRCANGNKLKTAGGYLWRWKN